MSSIYVKIAPMLILEAFSLTNSLMSWLCIVKLTVERLIPLVALIAIFLPYQRAYIILKRWKYCFVVLVHDMESFPLMSLPLAVLNSLCSFEREHDVSIVVYNSIRFTSCSDSSCSWLNWTECRAGIKFEVVISLQSLSSLS